MYMLMQPWLWPSNGSVMNPDPWQAWPPSKNCEYGIGASSNSPDVWSMSRV